MTRSTVDTVLRAHEVRSEKAVAYLRLTVISLFVALDILSYVGVVQQNPISLVSLVLDSAFWLYALIVVLVLSRNVYLAYLKYIVVTLDFALGSSFMLLDPETTISRNYMMGALVMLLIFSLNLLRYSPGATLYAGGIVALVYAWIAATFASKSEFVAPVGATLAIIMGIGYYLTRSGRNMIAEASTKRLMERYLPPQLVGELYKRGFSLEPGGKRQVVTILFSDIRNFTPLSEQLPAHDLVRVLNDYLSVMTEVIFEHQGTIDKFFGDAIVVLFGAPVEGNDDALRAVQAALEMNRRLAELNQRHVLPFPLQFGVGIHTGEAIVGNIGSQRRLDYTAIGDAVNLASRVEGVTKFCHCPILISQSTYQALPQEENGRLFLTREVGRVVVKGKHRPALLYEVVDDEDPVNRETRRKDIAQFERALQSYRARDFARALELFSERSPDRLGEIYVEHCRRLIDVPPAPDWDDALLVGDK